MTVGLLASSAMAQTKATTPATGSTEDVFLKYGPYLCGGNLGWTLSKFRSWAPPPVRVLTTGTTEITPGLNGREKQWRRPMARKSVSWYR